MVATGVGLLLAGTGVAAAFIFGGVRRRLNDLEQVAQRCGAGDFTARAPESGADELTAFASAFNRMAADLGVRDEQLKAADRTGGFCWPTSLTSFMTPLTALRATVKCSG
jgi:HAMP domain-containing protein